MLDQFIRRLQASALVSRTITCRRIRTRAFFPRGRSGFHPVDLLCDRAGGSPQVRYLSTVSTATSMPASDDPPK
jgi:hypothetical protein